MEPKKFVTFCQKDFSHAAFAVFAEMQKTGQLCDVKVQVQNCSFSAHRVILAGGIPYFLSLYTTSGVEDAEKEIVLPGDLCPTAVESLVQFSYTGKVDISAENVQPLLGASRVLQLDQVYDACIGFLSTNLHINNIVQVCSLAVNLDSVQLTESCKACIKKIFLEFSKTVDFTNLPHSWVKEIISGDDLCVRNEETVFKAVMKWVKTSTPERQNVLPELFSELRLIYLPIGYLIETVAAEELVRASKPCMDLIDDVKNYHLMPNCRLSFGHLKTRPRNCNLLVRKPIEPMKQCLYMICRVKTAVKKTAVIYYCDQNKWFRVASNIQTDPLVLVASSNQKIYMFLARTIQIFCMRTQKWNVVETNRALDKNEVATTLSLNNFIYCFPPESNNITFFKVCCFDTEQNRWCRKSLWKNPPAGSAICLLDGLIYVTGGKTLTWKHVYHKTAETYDPCTGNNNEISSMLEGRASHGCASLNGKMYVSGGHRNDILLSTAEVYDPLTNCWNYISSMNVARSHISLVPYCGKIYAFPGLEKPESNPQVEIYDAGESKVWNYDFDLLKGFKQLPKGFKHAGSY